MTIRRFLGAAVLGLTLCVTSLAAEDPEKGSPPPPPAAERAQALTARMKEKLALTDEQETKVAAINLRAAEAVDHATALPGAGRYDRFQSVKTAQATRDNELKGVLTQDQWKKYKKLKDELKDQVSAMAELKKKQQY
ncbi:MAG TPA: hypothetical protein VFV75_06080 [Candidatus Polarisedimenticolaceae bacterium]|nr:hypothetical protein [Candidatus Polarisedimenticolaceae bacterium]